MEHSMDPGGSASTTPTRGPGPDDREPAVVRPDATDDARRHMAAFQRPVVESLAALVAREPLVVVGMAQNPHVKNVRRALTEAGHRFEYVEHGSYLTGWSKRLAIKLWSGWPTFPQVFVRGVLLGGEDLTVAAIADGSLARRLAARSDRGGVTGAA